MVADHRKDYFSFLHTSLATIVSPIQYAVDWPIKSIVWLHTAITSQEALLKENASLRVSQILLQAELQKILALERENDQLRALLQSTPKISGDTVAAQLLAVDTAPTSHEVILNKGSRDGAYMGQPVFDAQGVMGQIIETGPFTSRVLLVTDNRSGIPVQVYRNGVRGVVEGTGSITHMSLVNIPITADIRVGDDLVTSGLANRFPEGYPVGVVSARTDQPGEKFAMISITPSAALNSSRIVLLVWPPILEPLIGSPEIPSENEFQTEEQNDD